MSSPATLTCPHCGLLNPSSSESCDCGFNFVLNTLVALPKREPSYAGFWERGIAVILDLAFSLLASGVVLGLLRREYWQPTEATRRVERAIVFAVMVV